VAPGPNSSSSINACKQTSKQANKQAHSQEASKQASERSGSQASIGQHCIS
jgi:hypothetical protein